MMNLNEQNLEDHTIENFSEFLNFENYIKLEEIFKKKNKFATTKINKLKHFL